MRNTLGLWLIIWVLSILSFYLIGVALGYIDSIITLIQRTTLMDHLVSVLIGTIAATVGWVGAKLTEKYLNVRTSIEFVAIAMVISICVEIPMYIKAVQIVTAT